jgi:putative PEP-CTERM system histidine kinase
VSPSVDILAAVCYGVGLAGFAMFGILLGWRWRRGMTVRLVIVATFITALWELLGFILAVRWDALVWHAYHLADVGRLAAWCVLLGTLGLRPSTANRSWKSLFTTRSGATGLALVVLVPALWLLPPAPDGATVSHSGEPLVFALLLIASVIGLALAEQLFRNTPHTSRWSIKPVCLGLGSVFAFDLFLFSDALLLRHLDPDLWRVRGAIHALAVPLVALSAARNRHWTIDLNLSHEFVFHSTAVVASGLYLLAVAIAGYYVRVIGGDWGKAMQVVLLFVAVVLLGWLFFSGTLRAKLRVLVNKHFFAYRYDYRHEWLRFTRLLSTPDPHLGVGERCIKALADLVESPGGALWVKRAHGYAQAARWNMPAGSSQLERQDSPMVLFLKGRSWVISLPELRQHAERYEGLELPAWLLAMSDAWLIIPLLSADELAGFAVLTEPRTSIELDWEVLDLLKTAGRQVGTLMAQLQANEALLEGKQFEAFSRMSAFVVHDLKNLVSQLSLMLSNAQRHRHNPEFQADMLATAEHVMARMNKLLLQLRAGATPLAHPALVELGPVARRICEAKRAVGRNVTLDLQQSVRALGHEDRLERVIGHLVQNALDATPDTGRVTLRVCADGAGSIVEVLDNGQGMSSEFIQHNLFRPFQTTKPSGMGIGFYESVQYVRELGGDVTVASSLGEGTRVTVTLPAVGIVPIHLVTREAAA